MPSHTEWSKPKPLHLHSSREKIYQFIALGVLGIWVLSSKLKDDRKDHQYRGDNQVERDTPDDTNEASA